MTPMIQRVSRRPVVLLVGCGDVGLRILRQLQGRWRVLVLTSSPQRVPLLRALGAVPLVGNLDDPVTLGRLAGLADRVVHLAPPPSQGEVDTRTANLVQALARRGHRPRIVYASTTGVYGDGQGARFDETRPLAPATARARRRVDAEARLRATGWPVSVLRVPGIYAPDREGGDPRERLQRGSPVLRRDEDVYTNHIHADDLARVCCAALWRAAPRRVYHVCDDGELLMGDHLEALADLCGLPRPPRLSRAELAASVSAVQMSFLSESRRLINRRMKKELRVQLLHATAQAAYAALPDHQRRRPANGG